MRLFGARSAAAFAHVLDRQVWIDHLAAVMTDMRYVSPHQVLGGILAIGERTQRVFDEGNRTSVDAIVDLKGVVRERLVTDGHIILPAEGVPAGVIEMSSRDTALLQAADIAAGYAIVRLDRGCGWMYGSRFITQRRIWGEARNSVHGRYELTQS